MPTHHPSHPTTLDAGSGTLPDTAVGVGCVDALHTVHHRRPKPLGGPWVPIQIGRRCHKRRMSGEVALGPWALG